MIGWRKLHTGACARPHYLPEATTSWGWTLTGQFSRESTAKKNSSAFAITGLSSRDPDLSLKLEARQLSSFFRYIWEPFALDSRVLGDRTHNVGPE